MVERKYIVFLGKDEIGTYTAQEIHEQFGILKKMSVNMHMREHVTADNTGLWPFRSQKVTGGSS